MIDIRKEPLCILLRFRKANQPSVPNSLHFIICTHLLIDGSQVWLVVCFILYL